MKRGYGSLLLLWIPFLLCACGKTENTVPAGMTPVPTAAVSTARPEPQAQGKPDTAGSVEPTVESTAEPEPTPQLEETESQVARELLRSLQTPYYCAVSPLCRTWVGVGADESYAYEFTVSDRGYFTLNYHDLTIADGLGEGNITWRSSGGIAFTEDRLILRLSHEGASFTTEYACQLEPDGLSLTNLGSEPIFANLEWEAEAAQSGSIYFRKYLPDIAQLAPAFAICGCYDQQEASEQHFWEVLTTAVSLYESSRLPEGAPIPQELRYSAEQLDTFATVLFGRYYTGELPDPADTPVTAQGAGIYRFPFREEVCAWRVELLEHFWNGSMLLAITEAGEAPIHIRFPLNNLYDDSGAFCQFQIRDILPVYLVESQGEYLNSFLGTHRYSEFAEPHFTRDYTVTVQTGEGGADCQVEVQIQGHLTDETLYCSAWLEDGDLQVTYIRGESQGEPAELYSREAGLFALYLTPGGGVTLRPQELYTFCDAPLREEKSP